MASARCPQEPIAGRTLEEWQQFSRRDDCLERMVPSDLRQIIGALCATEARRLNLSHKASRDGFDNMIDWIREYRSRTKATLKASKDAYEDNMPMPPLQTEGWQGMSTAPKDGDELLATDDRVDGGFPQVVYWSDGKRIGWHHTDALIIYPEDFFTHWRRDCLKPPSATRASLADAPSNPNEARP